jgi:pyrroline-5-carboxylate reductase
MFKDTTIAFIGSGTMAEAMIRGLLNQKSVTADQIIAAGPRPERGQHLQERHGIRVTTSNPEDRGRPGHCPLRQTPGPG